jgi:hypothetical protein
MIHSLMSDIKFDTCGMKNTVFSGMIEFDSIYCSGL